MIQAQIPYPEGVFVAPHPYPMKRPMAFPGLHATDEAQREQVLNDLTAIQLMTEWLDTPNLSPRQQQLCLRAIQERVQALALRAQSPSSRVCSNPA